MSQHQILDETLRQLVKNNQMSQQSEIQELLKEKGYAIPQATLSRKLKKLNIVKIGSYYKILDGYQERSAFVLDIHVSALGLIVLHTHPGEASSLALFIDQKYGVYKEIKNQSSQIIGTIAGDDTVLLVVKSKEVIDNVISLLRLEFPYAAIWI
jgi:transcriptional regulator of arginine metabolism